MTKIEKYSLECPISMKKEQDWLNSLGDVLSFPMADGYAYYLVKKRKPLTLQHIAIGDCWSLENWQLRGLTIKDVDEMLKQAEALKKLFS